MYHGHNLWVNTKLNAREWNHDGLLTIYNIHLIDLKAYEKSILFKIIFANMKVGVYDGRKILIIADPSICYIISSAAYINRDKKWQKRWKRTFS